jgi:hypothetical protein
MQQHHLQEDGFVSYEYAWPSVKCTFRTYSMLLKILPFALQGASKIYTRFIS